MVAQPSKVEQALIDQVGGLDLLVLDNNRIVVLRQGERVNTPSVLGPGGILGSDKPTVEYDTKIPLDKCLQVPFRDEIRLRYRGELALCKLEQRHVSSPSTQGAASLPSATELRALHDR